VATEAAPSARGGRVCRAVHHPMHTQPPPTAHPHLTRPSPGRASSGQRRSPARSGMEMPRGPAPNPAGPLRANLCVNCLTLKHPPSLFGAALQSSQGWPLCGFHTVMDLLQIAPLEERPRSRLLSLLFPFSFPFEILSRGPVSTCGRFSYVGLHPDPSLPLSTSPRTLSNPHLSHSLHLLCA
jgi:hypothetical protein